MWKRLVCVSLVTSCILALGEGPRGVEQSGSGGVEPRLRWAAAAARARRRACLRALREHLLAEAARSHRARSRRTLTSLDISLVAVKEPYELLGATNGTLPLNQTFHNWMVKVSGQREPASPPPRGHYSPTELFCLAILLPTGLYALFFVYIIFYTSTPSKVPLSYEPHDS